MSIPYVRRKNEPLNSDVLKRQLYIDDVADLDSSSLDRLVAECDVTVKCLQEEHDALDPDDIARVHVRHKRNIYRAYRQAGMIEQRMRGIDANERFYSLVAQQIGNEQAEALMTVAKG